MRTQSPKCKDYSHVRENVKQQLAEIFETVVVDESLDLSGMKVKVEVKVKPQEIKDLIEEELFKICHNDPTSKAYRDKSKKLFLRLRGGSNSNVRKCLLYGFLSVEDLCKLDEKILESDDYFNKLLVNSNSNNSTTSSAITNNNPSEAVLKHQLPIKKKTVMCPPKIPGASHTRSNSHAELHKMDIMSQLEEATPNETEMADIKTNIPNPNSNSTGISDTSKKVIENNIIPELVSHVIEQSPLQECKESNPEAIPQKKQEDARPITHTHRGNCKDKDIIELEIKLSEAGMKCNVYENELSQMKIAMHSLKEKNLQLTLLNTELTEINKSKDDAIKLLQFKNEQLIRGKSTIEENYNHIKTLFDKQSKMLEIKMNQIFSTQQNVMDKKNIKQVIRNPEVKLDESESEIEQKNDSMNFNSKNSPTHIFNSTESEESFSQVINTTQPKEKVMSALKGKIILNQMNPTNIFKNIQPLDTSMLRSQCKGLAGTIKCNNILMKTSKREVQGLSNIPVPSEYGSLYNEESNNKSEPKDKSKSAKTSQLV